MVQLERKKTYSNFFFWNNSDSVGSGALQSLLLIVVTASSHSVEFTCFTRWSTERSPSWVTSPVAFHHCATDCNALSPKLLYHPSFDQKKGKHLGCLSKPKCFAGQNSNPPVCFLHSCWKIVRLSEGVRLAGRTSFLFQIIIDCSCFCYTWSQSSPVRWVVELFSSFVIA